MGVSTSSETETAPILGPPAEVASARGLGRHFGLSGRLFLITVAFVAVAEILIYVPAVASYRLGWLSDRIAAAQVAATVLDAAPGQPVSEELSRRLLAGVGARAIVVSGGGTRRLLSNEAMPEGVVETVDLRDDTWWDSIHGSWRTLIAPGEEPLRVVGQGRDGFDVVEILIDEAPLRTAIVDFSIRLLLSSLIIAGAAAGLVFIVLQRVIVAPVRRLANNITAFADDPESLERVIEPSRRTDEIGHAETALARMEQALAGELREKRRLAELGLAVSKINHELRNLLTTAQLLVDRLEGAADPTVQRVAPRLVAKLGRAIRFCEATLAYGRATERHPQRRLVLLQPILAELPELAGLSTMSRVNVREQVPPGLQICADPEQLSRALTNLVRNAVQALDAAGAGQESPEVRITATRHGGVGSGFVTIRVSDNGPGLPERAKAHLFAPFQGSMRAGGTGLGLAIAAELVQLNGGTLRLEDGVPGASFRITVPDWVPGPKEAR